VLELTCLGDK